MLRLSRTTTVKNTSSVSTTRTLVLNSSGLTFTRNKSSARSASKGSSLSPQMQRVVTQLSVMSARKKQPKMLKLSNEDLIKHQTIQKAWKIYQDHKQGQRMARLKKQYMAINEAMETLKSISPELFKSVDIDESGKLFPMELRVPTDFPPREIWHDQYTPKETKQD